MARTRFTAKRRRPGRRRAPAPAAASAGESARQTAARLKSSASVGRSAADYRRKSLEIHGWFCAKCGRDFDETNLHGLTVHHRDGNHRNNPPDGSNWENLCVECHEDEHSRDMLGRYLSDGR